MHKYYDQYRINNINNLIRVKKFHKAEMEINEYKKLFPNDQLIAVCEARLLSHKKRLDEAEELLRFAIDSNINRKYVLNSALMELADVLKNKGNYDEAVEYYKKCIVNYDDPTYFFSIIKIIDLYLDTFKFDKAISFVNDLPKTNFDPMINVKKAEIYINSGNSKKALNILNSINDRNLDNENIQHKYYLLCKINYMNGNHKNVLEIIDNCFKDKNIYYWRASIILAKIKSAMNKDEEAIEICKNVIRLHPITDAINTLIKIYIKLGMIDDAREIVDSLLNDSKNQYLKEYYYGRFSLLDNEYEIAEKHFKKALDISYARDQSHELKYYLIVTKFRLKKYDEVKILINNYNCIINGISAKFHIQNDFNMMKAIIGNDYDWQTYGINQIQHYSKDLAISHVVDNHFKNGDFNTDLFQSTEDIIKLFDDIKNKLDYSKRIIRGFCDSYILYYENVGYTINDKSDFIEVICIPDTYNIITMYPTNRYRKNEQFKDKTSCKTKRLSQIDKFYKRYGK